MMNDQLYSDNEATESERFWEQHYRNRKSVWSGRPNTLLAEFATSLPSGSALDLGCSEGGDAVWLAQRGWQVTAVDVSATALRRAAAQAAAAGVEDRIDFQRHDLAYTFPTGSFDLVSALYLQSPIVFSRTQVLQAAASAVAPGGRLLVVEHASTAPWSWNQDPHQRFPPPEELLATLDLDPAQWNTEFMGAPTRQAEGPNGMTAEVADNVILVRRHPQ